MKILGLVLICLLTIYAPLELTRCIIIGAFIARVWADTTPLIIELSLMWLGYIFAMVFIGKWIRKDK